MEHYRNLGGNSAILNYNIEEKSITVWFKGNLKAYNYSYGSAGKMHVDTMKRLALNGSGLNAYINANVRELFDK